MTTSETSFSELGLTPPVLKALEKAGYETPSPIQAEIIPHILAGHDVLGQAQTGTGKTAAFALPILCRLNPTQQSTQLLVLTPTRELAIQVAEAFQGYACELPHFNIAPIYGGQEYGIQLRQLKRGAQIIVGTPGRVMDHIRRGSLQLNELTHLVLDEADEMLRMGFIDDVEWILEQTPAARQIALFSATMPAPIKKIAQKYLRNPIEVSIKSKTSTAATIRQRYWIVSGSHKLDALTRILEGSDFAGVIIFVRTKNATLELSEKLQARGYAATALNGDIDQKQRQRSVEQLKSGQLDILVATDVAARGLDVERISHVINYDIPHDTESYVHRIGRTGRAGREGEAILFVAPREKRMLQMIERATRQPIEPMDLPSAELINRRRLDKFKESIMEALNAPDLPLYRQIIQELETEQDIAFEDIAACLAMLSHGPALLKVKELPSSSAFDRSDRGDRNDRNSDRGSRDRPSNRDRDFDDAPRNKKSRKERDPDLAMELYRIEIGGDDGIKPGNIVGAIANEAGLESRFIGAITIHDSYTTVTLPEGMPKDVLADLQQVWVCGKPLRLSRVQGGTPYEANSGYKPSSKAPPKRDFKKPKRSKYED